MDQGRSPYTKTTLQPHFTFPFADGESNVDGANLALGETVPAAPRAIMTPGDVRAKVQPANPSSNGQPQQTTTSSGPENVSNKTPVVPSSGVSGRLKQLLDEEVSCDYGGHLSFCIDAILSPLNRRGF